MLASNRSSLLSVSDGVPVLIRMARHVAETGERSSSSSSSSLHSSSSLEDIISSASNCLSPQARDILLNFMSISQKCSSGGGSRSENEEKTLDQIFRSSQWRKMTQRDKHQLLRYISALSGDEEEWEERQQRRIYSDNNQINHNRDDNSLKREMEGKHKGRKIEERLCSCGRPSPLIARRRPLPRQSSPYGREPPPQPVVATDDWDKELAWLLRPVMSAHGSSPSGTTVMP